jgi:hypothetical protein
MVGCCSTCGVGICWYAAKKKKNVGYNSHVEGRSRCCRKKRSIGVKSVFLRFYEFFEALINIASERRKKNDLLERNGYCAAYKHCICRVNSIKMITLQIKDVI